MDASIKIVAHVGDVDPLNDGGVILDHGDGRPQLVYLVGNGEGESWDRFTIDLLDIEADATGPHGWIKPGEVALSCGMPEADYVAMCKSDDLQAKAQAVIMAAGYYGWENFDSYPVHYESEDEAQAWASEMETHPNRS